MRNIVVAVDFGDETDGVIDAARELASPLSAKVWLVHAAAPDPDFVGYRAGPQSVRDAVANGLREEHRQLQQLAVELRATGIDATALLLQGPTVQTLVKEARRLDADHIVIGSHGHGALLRTVLGSVSEGVLHGANCSVTVVRPPIATKPPDSPKRLVSSRPSR
jgi:nucleotide-binding universal stress UspA family protein